MQSQDPDHEFGLIKNTLKLLYRPWYADEVTFTIL